MFFANGGGPCWIVSIGNYDASGDQISAQSLRDGLAEVARISEVTLLVFPDAVNLSSGSDYYEVYQEAIMQAATLRNRFVIMDVFQNSDNHDWDADINGNAGLRALISGTPDQLKYAAAYFPALYTNVEFNYKVPGNQASENESAIRIIGGSATNLQDLQQANNAEYLQAKNAIKSLEMLLPAAAAIAGVYSSTDASHGVWKAPANVNINNVTRLKYILTNVEQEGLNVDVTGGKSINVIRSFPGKGIAIVWGARTLAGNDPEWRYISVVRFCLMVENAVGKGIERFVFEPNNNNTWLRVKAMTEIYLQGLWRSGALMGSAAREAFFVKAGLGDTMTETDIANGSMIVESGLAVTRPGEFVVLRFEYAMPQT